MARPKEDKRRINCSVLTSAYTVLSNDMRSKGYVSGNGLAWKQYLGAIAAQIVEGKLILPNRLT